MEMVGPGGRGSGEDAFGEIDGMEKVDCSEVKEWYLTTGGHSFYVYMYML